MSAQKIIVSGARGESYPDVLRRLGLFGVVPSDSDAQAVTKLNTDAALSASTAEAAAGPTYSTKAAGVSATTLGKSFAVDNGDGTVTIYLKDGATNPAQRTLATTAALAASGGSGLVTFTADGASAVPRDLEGKLRERVDLYDFAEGDGTTDDTAKVNQALANNAGNTIYLNGRTFLVSNLTLTSGTIIQGPGTIKRKTGAAGFMVRGSNVTDVQLLDVTFDGNNTGDAVQLVRVDGASHDFRAEGCTFKNSKFDGLAVAGTSARAIITNNRATANANHGIVVAGTGGQHLISGNICRSNGASGILVNADYTTVEGNKCFNNGTIVTSQAGILMLTCNYPLVNDNQTVDNGTGALFSHGIQFNTCNNGSMQGNSSIGNNGSGLDAYISARTTITGNQSISNKLRGIEIDSGSVYTTVVGNIVEANQEVGISVFNTVGANVANNTVVGNGTLGTAANPLISAVNSPYGIALWGAGNYGNYALIVGNTISGNVGSGSNGVGLYIHPSCVGVTVSNNSVAGNTLAATLVAANLAYAGQNFGLPFETSGATTIASGSVSVSVTFPSTLAYTPSAADISLTPLQAPTNAVGEIYPTSVSATGFTINCRNNPGSSGLAVSYRVKREAF